MPRTSAERYRDPLRATRLRREAARLFGCGEGQIDKMMSDGRLTFIRVGNRRQPTVSSIEENLGKPIELLEGPLLAGRGR